VISVDHIHKYYGAIKAVQDISFEVSQGEILGLLGPNGAGKTTTMRILTCFMPPTAGTAKIAGFDILEQPMEVRRQIGYMPENPPIYPEMIVSSFLRFVAEIKEVPKGQITKNVEKAMERVHIGDIRGRVIGHLSRGYRQRVGLAQALVHNPKVLILDEPTLGLDPSQIIEIRKLVCSLAEEKTVILSSHILSEVQAICKQVAIIHQGKIIAHDSLINLTEGQKILITLKGDSQEVSSIQTKISSIELVTKVSSRPSQSGTLSFEVFHENLPEKIGEDLYHLSVKNNWILIEMNPIKTSLEEIFLRMTSRESESEGDNTIRNNL